MGSRCVPHRRVVLGARFLAPSFLLLPLVCLCLTVFCRYASAQPASDDALDTYVAQSTFVFHGTVQQVRAVTMPVVPVSDATVVVTVQRILLSPDILGDYTGRSITMLARAPGALQVGQQAVFFTQGWMLGDGVAVREVGHVAPENLSEPKARLARARSRLADRRLRARIGRSDLIVVGRVSSVKPADVRAAPSEHGPQWQVASVTITTVLKGHAPDSLTVYFPGTQDIAWARSPKFTVDQRGIWLLHQDRELDTYTALDPLDFHAPDQRQRVERLMGQGENAPR
jgi:hypothetical protein